MKSILAILLVLASPILHAQEIKEAYNGYYGGSDLITITEHFKGFEENHSTRTILTTDSDSRDGMFFVLNIEDVAAVNEVKIHYIATDKIEAETTTFSLSGKSVKNWLYLGLTGNDWNGEELQVLAWKVDLLNASGEMVSEWKSFLWGKN